MSQKILHIGDQMTALYHHLGAMCSSGAALLLQVGQVWRIHGLGQDQQGLAEVEIISIGAMLQPDVLGVYHGMLELRFAGQKDTIFVSLLNFMVLERELVS